jgi:hypothetical protein
MGDISAMLEYDFGRFLKEKAKTNFNKPLANNTIVIYQSRFRNFIREAAERGMIDSVPTYRNMSTICPTS